MTCPTEPTAHHRVAVKDGSSVRFLRAVDASVPCATCNGFGRIGRRECPGCEGAREHEVTRYLCDRCGDECDATFGSAAFPALCEGCNEATESNETHVECGGRAA